MTYIETTNREILELYKGLETVKGIKGGRFSFLVAKNLKELKQSLQHIEDAAVPSQEFMEVSALAHKYAEEENEEAIQNLEKEHANLVEERKKQIEDVEKLLDENTKVAVELIREDQLPEEVTPEQVLPLLRIIKE
jgi:hypothetical protein